MLICITALASLHFWSPLENIAERSYVKILLCCYSFKPGAGWSLYSAVDDCCLYIFITFKVLYLFPVPTSSLFHSEDLCAV